MSMEQDLRESHKLHEVYGIWILDKSVSPLHVYNFLHICDYPYELCNLPLSNKKDFEKELENLFQWWQLTSNLERWNILSNVSRTTIWVWTNQNSG